MQRRFCDVCDEVIGDSDKTYRIMFSEHNGEPGYTQNSYTGNDGVKIGGKWVSSNCPYNDVCMSCFVKALEFVRQFYPKEGS